MRRAPPAAFPTQAWRKERRIASRLNFRQVLEQLLSNADVRLAWVPPPPAVGSICLSLRGQSVVLFTVTDMEYPRLGLINIENFDRFLMDAYEQIR